MLSEYQLEKLLEAYEARMQKLTDEYIEMMGKHLKEIGKLKASDVHRLTELKRVGINAKAMQKKLVAASNKSVSELNEIFKAVAEIDQRFAQQWFSSGYEPEVKGKPQMSKPIERILKAQLRITAQEFKNLSRTTIQTEAYRNAVDVAVQSVQAGVQDYKSAVRRAMKGAAEVGLRVKYPTGVTRRFDTAARQNVLDGVREINNDILRQLGNEYGADGVEISAHALCAEDHLPYQGKQFTNKEFERIQNSLDRPFGQWNCKHTIYPIILGVSERANDDDTLEKYRSNSSELITIDGKTKSRYDWSQEQRKVETAVRTQKDIANLAKASGDDVARREAQAKINSLKEYYTRISDAAGLEADKTRMTVAGFRNVKTAVQLKNTPKSGIIKSEGNKEYMRIYDAHGNEKYRYLHTDAIQKLDSSEAIVRYFTYEDRYGDTCSPITDEFSKFKLDVQKEIAEGIEWARTTYGLSGLPRVITREPNNLKAMAVYYSQSKKISFRPSTKIEDAFATAVHEMTHYVTDISRIDARGILERAYKDAGLVKGRSKTIAFQIETVGTPDSKVWKDPDELISYSLEREAAGKHNKLSLAISKAFMEEVNKRWTK